MRKIFLDALKSALLALLLPPLAYAIFWSQCEKDDCSVGYFITAVIYDGFEVKSNSSCDFIPVGWRAECFMRNAVTSGFKRPPISDSTEWRG